MSGGGKEYTVGYWYGLGMHMVLCHGPVDEVQEVQVGERTAWTGSATSNASININRRDLFGGEEREGGVDGTLDVMMGAQTSRPTHTFSRNSAQTSRHSVECSPSCGAAWSRP